MTAAVTFVLAGCCMAAITATIGFQTDDRVGVHFVLGTGILRQLFPAFARDLV
jgi:hypothetical protein